MAKSGILSGLEKPVLIKIWSSVNCWNLHLNLSPFLKYNLRDFNSWGIWFLERRSKVILETDLNLKFIGPDAALFSQCKFWFLSSLIKRPVNSEPSNKRTFSKPSYWSSVRLLWFVSFLLLLDVTDPAWSDQRLSSEWKRVIQVSR